MKKDFKDNIVYECGDDKIIFHSLTYYEIVKGCIVEYGKKTEQEADKILSESNFFSKGNYPPKNYAEVALLDHELPHHIAMLSVFGDQYWDKKLNTGETVGVVTPENYYHWETVYIKIKKLKNSYFDYI